MGLFIIILTIIVCALLWVIGTLFPGRMSKGGHNDFPSSPRPPAPPGQRPALPPPPPAKNPIVIIIRKEDF